MSNKLNSTTEELLDQIIDKNSNIDIENYGTIIKTIKKRLLEKKLNAEINKHLGYIKNSKAEKSTDNRRNVNSRKTIIDGEGDQLEINIPRDRKNEFEPKILPKKIRRLPEFDNKVISMYARGMTVNEIQAHLKEIYNTDISADLISDITDEVLSEVEQWQNRALENIYPIIYLDCLFVKSREGNVIINKAIYLAIGINLEGKKEILGIWINKTEGSKFWMQICTELKNRGINKIYIACIDGLKGFTEAINNIFPQTQVQLCIVHLIRNSLKYVSYKNKKEVSTDLKSIYQSVNEKTAKQNLENFEKKWTKKYPVISTIWKNNWINITPFFNFTKEIRKVIYTTNIIESTNRQIRKIIKNKGVFPTENSIKKILYLTLQNASKKWTMPLKDWPLALNQFQMLYGHFKEIDEKAKTSLTQN